jgi:prefoldin subunit 2
MEEDQSTTSRKYDDQELVAQFRDMRSELQNTRVKLGELEAEVNEHALVIETLQPLDGQRKCFRLVGGVLVERTVKDVLPALKSNKEGVRL